MEMDENIPLDAMYRQRRDYVIVALTGITGSGCSKFAELMASTFSKWADNGLIRRDEDIETMLYSKDKQEVVFARKYLACYNVCQKQYKTTFKIIQYRNVLLLYSMLELTEKYGSYEDTLSALSRMITGKFGLSFEKEPTDLRYDVDTDFSTDLLKELGFTKQLYDLLSDVINKKDNLWSLYSSACFESFCTVLYKCMKQKDYYSKNFFVHRLGCSIRATGGCESTHEENMASDNKHVFCVIELINDIIKAYHDDNPCEERKFVIDSIRNSVEILFLRERYYAFYTIALHNDGKEEMCVNDKLSEYIENEEHRSTVCHNIMELSKIEKKMDDFEKGLLFSPDLSRCVTESEIHISFNNNTT